MGVWAQMKKWFVLHLLIGYVFVVSGLIVNFLMLCSCIIWPFNKVLYRKINCLLAYSHWCQFTFLAQWWSGSDCELIISPEDEKYVGKEHALIIMNHKYDIDWLMGWIIAERYAMLGGSKIYGKQMLRYVPLIGWAWYFTESIFLKRNWEHDRQVIMRDLKNLTHFPVNYWVTILLFCEGTRFTEEKHKGSMEVAKLKGYPLLKHHLLPRSKGFVLTMHGLKGKLPAIYDCTVAFRKDGAEPTLMNILAGKACKAEMHVRRIRTEDVPTTTDEECADWLRKFYKHKDDVYESFVQKGYIEGNRHRQPRRYRDLLMWLFWAVILCVPLFSYLGKVFLSGTLTQQLTLLVIVAVASIGVRAMIGVTEIHRGSGYGKAKIQENGSKKTS
ncbi:1-acyl-sn-glycerol-3-phosphate acyltransferase gamma-like [Liolophura sinensis]|uniref:1-acyl-sn-glycerol-3-phosphate acyltransferase gamma-like n=1 Tax=Liolophura sinensis TaxID=3198878 RepID=UPI003158937F